MWKSSEIDSRQTVLDQSECFGFLGAIRKRAAPKSPPCPRPRRRTAPPRRRPRPLGRPATLPTRPRTRTRPRMQLDNSPLLSQQVAKS